MDIAKCFSSNCLATTTANVFVLKNIVIRFKEGSKI